MATDGDIRMTFDPEVGYGDFVVENRDIERDAGLETAVMVSLGTNRRADAEDELPDADGSLAGWWADALDGGDKPIGSKLWLLGRGKAIASELVPRAEQYTKEALQWMKDEGVAQEITATASIVDSAHLSIAVTITRPDSNEPEAFQFFYNWRNQELRSV